VPQDWAEAYIWFSLAAMSGLSEGARSRDLAREQLTPQALERAQSQAASRLTEIQLRVMPKH